MKRAAKYPDTDTFHFHNANPHNRFTTDCVIRAISTATSIPYNTVVMEMAEMQCKTGFDMSENTLIDKYLKSKGWTKNKQPRKSNNTKYTGREFCKVLQEWLFDEEVHGMEYKDGVIISPRLISNIGGHHIVAIMDGKVWDTWNSTDGCIGNYWTK